MRLVRSHGFVEAEQYLAAWRVIRGLPWTTDGSTRCSRHLRPVRGIDRFHDIQWHSACRMCQSPHLGGSRVSEAVHLCCCMPKSPTARVACGLGRNSPSMPENLNACTEGSNAPKNQSEHVVQGLGTPFLRRGLKRQANTCTEHLHNKRCS